MSASGAPATNETGNAAKRARRKAQITGQGVNVEDLEKRVLIAELRAREVEAELRYLLASQQRRELVAGKRDKGGKRKNKNNNNKTRKTNAENEAD
jgi:hypothetical protein